MSNSWLEGIISMDEHQTRKQAREGGSEMAWIQVILVIGLVALGLAIVFIPGVLDGLIEGFAQSGTASEFAPSKP